MIRLNAATSNKAKRRQSTTNGSSSNNRNKKDSNNNTNTNINNEEGTHDDMYDDDVGTSNKHHQLFEELLGDNASAIGSVNKAGGGGGGDDASTAMSSVLGPILRGKNGKGSNNELGKICEDGNNGTTKPNNRGSMMNFNSNNSPTLHQLKNPRHHQNHQNQHHQNQNQQQQQPPKNQQFDEETDADTLMTKPREIAFDQDNDDISALYGGHGGTGGVESYMGTVAAQRKNRARGQFSGNGNGGSGGMGMFGARGGNGRNNTNSGNSGGGVGKVGNNNSGGLRDEDSRRTGRTGGTSTFQSRPSMGVTTILEEIGLGPSYKKEKGSVEEEEYYSEEEKGHNTRSRSRNSPRGGRGSKRRKPQTLWGQLLQVKSSRWLVLIVSFMFVAIQFTTVQKHDKATMDHLNWRFQNHRYNTAQDNANVVNTANADRYASASHNGLSAGIRNIAMDNVEGNDGRRRGVYNSNTNQGKDGLGDVLRKSVPLLPQTQQGQQLRQVQQRNDREWEHEQIMNDDGMAMRSNTGNNLRGSAVKMVGVNEQYQSQQKKQYVPPRMMQQPKPRQVQQQVVQQQPQVLQVPPQQGYKMMTSDTNPNPPQNLGNTHPLLTPKQGLSMADALTKLQVSNTDTLAEIDPHRPQQHLSNDMLPSRFNVFADLKTPYEVGRDTPYFWHVPRSGGVVIKTMLSHCLGQVLAAEVGELDGHEGDTELKVISFSEHNYTNVNIATPDGISRALNLGLVPSHLSNTLVSAHVDLVPSLFNANDRARAFALFRHPVDRAASMFYFLQGTGYPPLKNMTVDDYAKSELIENNWLVRILSESMTGAINMDNLEIAKEVLRRKFIVGLLDNKRGSFARFDHYFKWKESPKYEKEFGCRKQLMDEKYTPKHPIRKDSVTWKLLLEQNRFDVHLYDFVKELFSQQSYIFGL